MFWLIMMKLSFQKKNFKLLNFNYQTIIAIKKSIRVIADGLL